MNHFRISLIHPTGNPNVRNAAVALAEWGVLQEIITTLAYDPNGQIAAFLQRLPPSLANPLARELARRTWIAPSGVVLRTYPARELLRVALMRLGIARGLRLNPQSLTDWIYTALDRAVARRHLSGITGVYAYEDGAADTFAVAKERDILCFYDLPIVFYRQSCQIQAEERDRFPELASALQSTREPAWKLERKEREIQLADRILVASSIVKQSLLNVGVLPEKISVIPFGSPCNYFSPHPKTDTTFRALFVGRVGPRKGVHYLFRAWRKLNLPNAELLCVGFNEFPSAWLSQYQDAFNYIPSVPHASLQEYYNRADVFVFPSLVEGLALVLLEAMACGLPIITTTHSGGSDIITDGVEGFIIPIRDAIALEEKLEWCYSHPAELAEMGRAARRKAEVLTWELYRERLRDCIAEVLSARASS
ncbi:MAG: glycosyltransferase family 4 protein [Cyanobacteriota bacterium]|nr:glycosyltransferase family 4 protein [Cyanobacteriota bacterium]